LIRRRDQGAEQSEQRRYRAMLATLSAELPKGDGWRFEVKWDGYRALAYVRDGECELVSRNGNSLTARFDGVATAVPRALKTSNGVAEGGVWALEDGGRPSFPAMQRGTGRIVVYVFDLLGVDGERVVALPLEARQSRLAELVDQRNRTVRISE